MLSPQIVVIALHMGNDLWDAYNMVYQSEAYSDLRSRSDLSTDTIAIRIKEIHETPNKPDAPPHGTFLDGLPTVMIFKQLSFIDDEVEFNRWKNWAKFHPQFVSICDSPNSTAFTPGYRLLAVDSSETTNYGGIGITKEMLLRIRGVCSYEGIGLQPSSDEA